MAAHVTQSDKKKKGPKLTTTPHKKKNHYLGVYEKRKPCGGLEPPTLRLRVSRATDCASKAYLLTAGNISCGILTARCHVISTL